MYYIGSTIGPEAFEFWSGLLERLYVLELESGQGRALRLQADARIYFDGVAVVDYVELGLAALLGPQTGALLARF